MMVSTCDLNNVGAVFGPLVEQGSHGLFSRKAGMEEHERHGEDDVEDIAEHESIDIDSCLTPFIGDTRLTSCRTAQRESHHSNTTQLQQVGEEPSGFVHAGKLIQQETYVLCPLPKLRYVC
jgi:hypothetical protein